MNTFTKILKETAKDLLGLFQILMVACFIATGAGFGIAFGLTIFKIVGQ